VIAGTDGFEDAQAGSVGQGLRDAFNPSPVHIE
jgi:hypothetical protein